MPSVRSRQGPVFRNGLSIVHPGGKIMAIVFDESLRTGNGLIDTQHQELIARVNKLTEDCRVGAEYLVAVQSLHFLMGSTNIPLSDR